ncbi:hypothetical protein [uncultured Methylobacterium sp.]|jgi:hypothetical protein|uniref:hypothetical protein n=1 Tax=uncultured Methylobacterium sp. TaxID=157278 RepID=UPI0026339414|nr:hypothetical protein [uncultured Methylobacterium sp.]
MDLQVAPRSWRIPLLGRVAEDDLPAWLIARLSDGRVQVNSFGGLTVDDEQGRRWCPGGDTVVLDDDGTVWFVPTAQV